MPRSLQEPTTRDLRQFALILGLGLPLLFGLVFPLAGGGNVPLWPWLVGAAFLVWGFTAPASLKPVFLAWLRLAHAIGRVVTPVILSVTWLVAVVPTGLIMRLVGNDPMRRKWDPESSSYLRRSEQRPKSHMERPF
jgi:amino acid transporter